MIERFKDESKEIKKILRENPDGMTVIELSTKLNVNRNSVAKYLDILRVAGQVDMRSVGPARLYFLSNRIPLSTMLNFSSDNILTLNKDLKVIQANENFINLMDSQKEKILGLDIQKFRCNIFHDEEIMSKVKEALNGNGLVMERKFAKEKTDFYFRIRLIPTTFEDGSKGVTLILEDITKSKLAEEKLKEQEESMRALINATTESVILIEPRGIVVTINETAAKRLNRKVKDMIGKNIYDFMPARVAKSRRLENQKAIDTGRPIIYSDKRGQIWFKNTIYPIFDSSAKVIQLAVFARDVSKGKMAQDRLKASEGLMRSLIYSMDDLVFVISDKGVFEKYFQPETKKELYAPPSEFLGKNFKDVLPYNVVKQLDSAMENVKESGKVSQIEYSLDIKGKKRNFSAKISPLINEEGARKCFVVVVRDI